MKKVSIVKPRLRTNPIKLFGTAYANLNPLYFALWQHRCWCDGVICSKKCFIEIEPVTDFIKTF